METILIEIRRYGQFIFSSLLPFFLSPKRKKERKKKNRREQRKANQPLAGIDTWPLQHTRSFPNRQRAAISKRDALVHNEQQTNGRLRQSFRQDLYTRRRECHGHGDGEGSGGAGDRHVRLVQNMGLPVTGTTADGRPKNAKSCGASTYDPLWTKPLCSF